MPFDEALADRVRRLLKRRRGVTEKRMFGGLCFLLHGHMCCGVERDRLVVRVGPEEIGGHNTSPQEISECIPGILSRILSESRAAVSC